MVGEWGGMKRHEILKNIHYLKACYNVVHCAYSLVSVKGYFSKVVAFVFLSLTIYIIRLDIYRVRLCGYQNFSCLELALARENCCPVQNFCVLQR